MEAVFIIVQISFATRRILESGQGHSNIPQFQQGHVMDVRANCFCATLLRAQIHTPRHARERALSNKMNKNGANGHCYSFSWI